jgi:hypothetical protein
MGPIPYGITWRLVLLKLLPQPSRPIRVYMQSKRKGDGINIMSHFHCRILIYSHNHIVNVNDIIGKNK